MTINLITATSDSFKDYIGQVFLVESPDGPVELILDNIKIRENPSIRDKHLQIEGIVYPPRHPFALTFIGPHDQALQSLTYRVYHEKTGEMDLFISAFRQDHDCMLYESTFT